MSQKFSLREAIDEANPNKLSSALQQMKLGTSLKKIRATIAAMTAASAVDLTAIPAAKITIDDGPDNVIASGLLPPIGQVTALRVSTSGTANSVGAYIASDDDSTPLIANTSGAVGIAAQSDDDKTLTFPNTITGFVIEYYAKPGSVMKAGVWTTGPDLNDDYAQTSGGIGD